MNRGDLAERARLNHILSGEKPSREAIEKLLDGQRTDGGWAASWATDYSSLDATCFRFSQAEQMGLGESDHRIAQALALLSRRQHSNGSWEEDNRFRDSAPPWAKPGNEQAKIYISALCSSWLTILKKTKIEASLASHYLQGFVDEKGHLPTFPHGHWLAGGMWYSLGMKDLAERVFEYLEARLGELRPSNFGWLINTLHLEGVPIKHPLVDKAATFLERHQQQNGRWEAEDGSNFDVNATIEAVRALKVCQRLNSMSD